MSEQIILVTPPVNVTGEFTALPPFELTVGMVYRCHAIRTIEELLAKGQDVYAEYYRPKNLSIEIFKRDQANKVSIITLLSANDNYIYVPNSYMESYPGMSGIDYLHKVIFIECGLLPAHVDINYIIPQLKDTITKAIGVEVTPLVGVVPYSGTVSHKEHIQLERTRRLAIQGHVTCEEEITNLKAQVAVLQKTNEDLASVIAAHPELASPIKK